MWMWLKDNFETEQSEDAQELKLNKIRQVKIEHCQDLDELHLKLSSKFRAYKSVGGTLTDSKKKSHLLRASQEQYSTICDSLRAVGTTLTYNEVLKRFKAIELERKMEANREPKAVKESNNMTVNRDSITMTHDKICFICLNPLHMAKECPFNIKDGNKKKKGVSFALSLITGALLVLTERTIRKEVKKHAYQYSIEESDEESDDKNGDERKIDSKILSARIQF